MECRLNWTIVPCTMDRWIFRTVANLVYALIIDEHVDEAGNNTHFRRRCVERRTGSIRADGRRSFDQIVFAGPSWVVEFLGQRLCYVSTGIAKQTTSFGRLQSRAESILFWRAVTLTFIYLFVIGLSSLKCSTWLLLPTDVLLRFWRSLDPCVRREKTESFLTGSFILDKETVSSYKSGNIDCELFQKNVKSRRASLKMS